MAVEAEQPITDCHHLLYSIGCMINERLNPIVYLPEVRIYRVILRKKDPFDDFYDCYYATYNDLFLVEGQRVLIGIGRPCERCSSQCLGDIVVAKRNSSQPLTDRETIDLIQNERKVVVIVSFDARGFPNQGQLVEQDDFNPYDYLTRMGEEHLSADQFVPDFPEIVFTCLTKTVKDIC